jgi:hypothetical protein
MFIIATRGKPDLVLKDVPSTVKACLRLAHDQGKPVLPGGMFLTLYTYLAEQLSPDKSLKFLRSILRGTGCRIKCVEV